MKVTWTKEEMRQTIDGLLNASDDMEMIMNTDGKLDEYHESYGRVERLFTFCTVRELLEGLGEREDLDEDEYGDIIFIGDDDELIEIFEMFREYFRWEADVVVDIEIEGSRKA